MRPPICEICEKYFNPDEAGGLVYFKETEAGREFERKCREEGMVGHPPDAGWFCGEHVELAKNLKHLTIDEALEEIGKQLKK